MSTRNPMNERYTTDAERTGSSRKSASSAKPKAKAANTVTVVGTAKTAKEKKALAKQKEREQREKARKEEAKFYQPPTERYKKLRRLWWVCLIAAILCTVLSWVANSNGASTATVVTMVLAYVFIIVALYVDLGPTRKERKRYQAAVADKSSEEHAAFKAAEKAAKEAEKAQKAEAKGAYDATKAEETAKPGLLSRFKKHVETANERVGADAGAAIEAAPASKDAK